VIKSLKDVILGERNLNLSQKHINEVSRVSSTKSKAFKSEKLSTRSRKTVDRNYFVEAKKQTN